MDFSKTHGVSGEGNGSFQEIGIRLTNHGSQFDSPVRRDGWKSDLTYPDSIVMYTYCINYNTLIYLNMYVYIYIHDYTCIYIYYSTI